ncbi:MAG TPA: MFS transporter [Exilispira sp.]|nr:MFS transporter [Exilispira sp.]
MKTILIKSFSEYSVALKESSKEVRFYILGNLLFGIGVNLIALLFNLYCQNLSFSESSIGKLLSSKALGSAPVTLPAAFLLTKINLRLLFIFIPVISSLLYFGLTLTSDFYAILPLTFLTGAFSTFFSVANGPFIMNNTSEKHQVLFFSLNGALGMFTGMIGNFIGGFLQDSFLFLTKNEILSYRISISIGALFILLSIIAFSKIKLATLKRSEKKTILSISNPVIYIKLILPTLFIGIGAGLTIPYINLYFKNVFHMSDSLIGLIYGISQAFTFIGIMLGPLIARKIGKPMTIVVTQALSIPFILILTYIKNPVFVVLAFFIRGTLMNMASPLSDNFALENVPKEEQSFLNALKMFTWTGSWMIAARISGSVIEKDGFSRSFTLTAILYAISTIFYAIFFLLPANSFKKKKEKTE